jgi:hypothetical protein
MRVFEMVMKISKKKPVNTKQDDLALEAQVSNEPNGVGTVEITHADGSEESTQEVVLEPVMTDNPAYVSLSMGLTRNLGDFESLKMLVGITVKCNNTPEEVEETYSKIKEWVDTKVTEISAEVDAQLEGAE